MIKLVAQNRDPRTLRRIIRNIEWSQDGTKLASISYVIQNNEFRDRRVEISDATTDEVLLSLSYDTNLPTALAWRPSSNEILVGFSGGLVQRIDATSGQNLGKFQFNDMCILTVSWNRDGSMFASGGWNNTLWVQNVDNNQLVFQVDFGTPIQLAVDHAISWLGWSPDNTRLAVSGWDGITRIFSSNEWIQVLFLQVNDETIYWSGWSPDGTKLATGCEDGSIYIWNTSTGQLVHTLSGHAGSVNTLSWNIDAFRLASCSSDGTIKIWNADTGVLLNMLETDLKEVVAVAWSPKNDDLVYGGQLQSDYLYFQWLGDVELQPNELLTAIEAEHQKMTMVLEQIPSDLALRFDLIGGISANFLLADLIGWQMKTIAMLTAVRDNMPLPIEKNEGVFLGRMINQRANKNWLEMQADFAETNAALLDLARSLPERTWQNPLVSKWLRATTINYYHIHIDDFRRALPH